MRLDRPVIDASIAVKWFLTKEIYAAEANLLLQDERILLVPDLIFSEVGNITWKQVRKGTLPQAEAVNIVTTLSHLGLMVYPSETLIVKAVEIACETGRTAYDSLYVARAIQEDSAVVTADEKLKNGLQDTPYARYIVWIEDLT